MKSLLIAATMFLNPAPQVTLTAESLNPEWYKRYNHHKRKIDHFHAKFLVMNMRLSIAMNICVDRNCFVAAHEAWKPSMEISARMYGEARHMDRIAYDYCGIPENIPVCITMLKHRRDPVYGGNYQRFFGGLMMLTKKLDEVQRKDLMNEKPRLDQPGMPL